MTFDNSAPARLRHAVRRLALFMAGGQVYEVTSTDRSQDVEILSTYVERDILQSGWLLGEQVIAKKAAAVSVKHGAGKVVLIGFRPQHRDQTHGTFKLVFNASSTREWRARIRNPADPLVYFAVTVTTCGGRARVVGPGAPRHAHRSRDCAQGEVSDGAALREALDRRAEFLLKEHVHF